MSDKNDKSGQDGGWLGKLKEVANKAVTEAKKVPGVGEAVTAVEKSPVAQGALKGAAATWATGFGIIPGAIAGALSETETGQAVIAKGKELAQEGLKRAADALKDDGDDDRQPPADDKKGPKGPQPPSNS